MSAFQGVGLEGFPCSRMCMCYYHIVGDFHRTVFRLKLKFRKFKFFEHIIMRINKAHVNINLHIFFWGGGGEGDPLPNVKKIST